MSRASPALPGPHYLQDLCLRQGEGSTLVPLAHPQELIRTVADLKHICSGYLGIAKSIELFFQLLHLTDVDRHSFHRERFWRRYLEAGYINQSWLILASEAAAIALRHLGIKSHQFARLAKNRRIDDKHAVLLMRLDHLVIAEWSHSGKCRFWHQGNIHAPSIFKQTYSRDELSDYADYVQQHYFSAKGLWQKDAAAWISAKAQIPILT